MIRIKQDKYKRWYVDGISKDFAAYERKILKGQIPCPYTVTFKNTKGEVVANGPLALTPNGKLKQKSLFAVDDLKPDLQFGDSIVMNAIMPEKSLRNRRD